jgi:hypothetical protein
MTIVSYVDLYEAVKYDVRLHGARFITLEFAAATALAIGLTILELTRAAAATESLIAGLWFAGFGLNSLAVTLLARHAGRTGTQSEVSERRVQFFALGLVVMLLIPALVAALSLLQWRRGDLDRQQGLT